MIIEKEYFHIYPLWAVMNTKKGGVIKITVDPSNIPSGLREGKHVIIPAEYLADTKIDRRAEVVYIDKAVFGGMWLLICVPITRYSKDKDIKPTWLFNPIPAGETLSVINGFD